MRQVFVPGGQPVYTYVPREEKGLESQLSKVTDNLCKLVTVTGNTKSGKSVLTQKLFPRGTAIWIDGGAVADESDFWAQVTESIGDQPNKRSNSKPSSDLLTRVSDQAKVSIVQKPIVRPSRRSSGKAQTVESLRESGVPLIIDDFHYLDRETQGNIVRALKALVFEGHPVILLAIPHRKYDAIRVEKEMTGRVHNIAIPLWGSSELSQIANIGFPLLKMEVEDRIVKQFCDESLGSPHLMQEFCRQACEREAIDETLNDPRKVAYEQRVMDQILKQVAADTSKLVFDRLAKGPRQRSDRNQRQYKAGGSGDIYEAVLRAIASLRPGTVTLEYEQIRSALRELLEEIPQAHEVSRVLEHMSKIQLSDGSSAPVLDWDKEERKLHITDPFFAFFLRWGTELPEIVVE